MDGYKIIDLKSVAIEVGGSYEEIPGIFNAVHTANKPMVITNLVIRGESDIHLKPFFTNMVFGGAEAGYSTILLTENGSLSLLIEPEDHVSLIAIE